MTFTNKIFLATSLTALMTFPLATFAMGSSTYRPSAAGVPLEVVMHGDGSASVKGARVREVTSTGFTAETLWGSGKLTWTVKTGENTPITRKSGARITLAEVTPGDYVSFAGDIQTNLPPFTITADSVRDWSIGENHIVHSGTVTDIDADARTFTLTTAKGGTVTVRTTDDTAYAQSGARSFLDLSVGDTVLAFGGASQGGKVVAATKVNITERALTRADERKAIATGFGTWVDNFLPRFFVGRMQ